MNKNSDEFCTPPATIIKNLASTTMLINDLRPSLERDIEAIKTLGGTIKRGTPTIETAFGALPDLLSPFMRSQSYGSNLHVYPCIFGISLIGDEPLWLRPTARPFSAGCRVASQNPRGDYARAACWGPALLAAWTTSSWGR